MMQKFQKGDWVRIAKDLGSHMSHFASDCEAIVEYSYAERYGGRDTGRYSLHLKDGGKVSWYYGSQLTLIKSGCLEKLKAWEDEAEAEHKRKSDLDWIFANGPTVAENPHTASIKALAECFGLTNLWGSNGEGVTYCSNAMRTMVLALPHLKAGDKAGWLARCELLREEFAALEAWASTHNIPRMRARLDTPSEGLGRDAIQTTDAPHQCGKAQDQAPTAWQPIETAPRNCGVLVWDRVTSQSHKARWSNTYKVFVRASGVAVSGASHWMPMPEPPDAEAARAESLSCEQSGKAKG